MKYSRFWIYSLISLIFSSPHASTLFEDAKAKQINETCSNYLNQIEKSYDLNGLNITFAHANNPSTLPSLHISTQKYNNGTSSFSATLTPDGDYCYLSSIYVTSINDQSCSDVEKIKMSIDNKMQVNRFLEDSYTILTPPDNSYQIILTSSGEKNCTITEIRMMWPGK
jgi:hypothetical protein